MSTKKKILSLQERVTVLKRLESGTSCRVIAAELRCGKTQIGKIRLEKEAIMAEWNSCVVGLPDTSGYYWVECAGLAGEGACPTRVGTTGWSVLAWLMREPA